MSEQPSDVRSPGLAAWRAAVERELAGAPFDKLVHTTAEGLKVQPLYTEPAAEVGAPAMPAAPFRICLREEVDDDEVAAEVEARWVDSDDGRAAVAAGGAAPVVVVTTAGPAAVLDAWLAARPAARLVLGADPVAAAARGALAVTQLDAAVAEAGRLAARFAAAGLDGHAVVVSTLPVHDAGADAADELAIALATAAAYLRTMVDAGMEVDAAARQLGVQVAVGRDTFGELCKLRALRRVWSKLLVAAGASALAPASVHAVCSARTLSERDPWVNLLRVTTQVFAAVLGGAELVTPRPFDAALGAASALGRRAARNTALVLREESHLGRVVDPAAGSYYLEAHTDALAREAWRRFTALERGGGVVAALRSGALTERLAAAWSKRRDAIARRKEPVLGVSEFANLDEQVPARGPARGAAPSPLLAPHRDAEPFEALRAQAEALGAAAPAVLLSTLGPPAEHRARAGFSTALLATGGLRTREAAAAEAAPVAVICGSDERYAAEAADRARALKAAGCRRVLLAGRPGALEASLREAGVDGFIFLGCDVVAALADVLAAASGGAS